MGSVSFGGHRQVTGATSPPHRRKQINAPLAACATSPNAMELRVGKARMKISHCIAAREVKELIAGEKRAARRRGIGAAPSFRPLTEAEAAAILGGMRSRRSLSALSRRSHICAWQLANALRTAECGCVAAAAEVS